MGSKAVRLTDDNFEQLEKAAKEMDMTITWLTNKLISEGLEHMIDPAEFSLTKPRSNRK